MVEVKMVVMERNIKGGCGDDGVVMMVVMMILKMMMVLLAKWSPE